MMKDLLTMMAALHRFCAERNIEMPISIEIKFSTEIEVVRFESVACIDAESDGAFYFPLRKIHGSYIYGTQVHLSSERKEP